MKALCFSGGKDSVACLLLQSSLEDVHVIWANTGKNLPEVVAFVESFKKICPHWHEVRTDRDAQNRAFGMPADVVPIRFTSVGQQCTKPRPVMIQPYLQCCYENISLPVWEKIKELGCDVVIRGQRRDEANRSPFENGSTFEGVTFEHPIEGWTREMVLEFVQARITVPEHFALDHTSVDCYDCTAFLDHAEDRAEYLRRKHPEKYHEFMARVRALDTAVHSESSALRRIAHG